MRLNMFKVVCVVLISLLMIGSMPIAFANTPTTDNRVNLQFAVTDAISTPDGSAIFLLARGDRQVHKLNTSDFSMTSVTFDLIPHAFTYSDGKLFVALATQAHSSFRWDSDQRGAFAIVDASSLDIEAIHNVSNIDPFDIAVTNEGFVVISSGSGQWTTMRSFSQDGTLVSTRSSVRQSSPIVYNSHLGRIYSVTTDSSPRTMGTFTVNASGAIGAEVRAPYHGTHSIGIPLRISPSGTNIFTSSGTVFANSGVQADDMRFRTRLNTAWADLTFSQDGERFYTALSDGRIYAYNYATFEGFATFEAQGFPQFLLTLDEDTLLAVSRTTANGSVYFMETIDLTAPRTTIETTVTTRAIAFEDGRAQIGVRANTVTKFNDNMIYIVDNRQNAVFVIDAVAMTETKITFPNAPNSLCYRNGELFVGFGNNGFVAVLDSTTFAVKDRIITRVQFTDLAIGRDGHIYVVTQRSLSIGGVFSFSRTTGQQISNHNIMNSGWLVPHPTFNMFYFATTGVSPQNIHAVVYNDGRIVTSYRSPYHGHHSFGARLRISPSGENIFTSSGNVFRSSNVQADDMRFRLSLNRSWVDLAFSQDGTKFYTALSDGRIYVYNYATFEGFATFEARGFPQELFALDEDTLLAISRETQPTWSEPAGGSVHFLEIIDLTAPTSLIETTITTRNLTLQNGRVRVDARVNSQTIFNDNMIYVADNSQNAVFAIDTVAMTETKITFPNTPNSLYYRDGELFVGFGSNGVIAILDSVTFESKKRIVTGTPFNDFAVGRDGYIYGRGSTSSSSNSFFVISPVTGQRVDSRNVWNSGRLVASPTENAFYIVGGSSTNVIRYANGRITVSYEVWNSSRSVGARAKISPDGLNLFGSSGNVFRISTVQAEDMRFRDTFVPFNDMTFDLPNNQIFLSPTSGANIQVYDYTTFEQEGFIRTALPVREMTLYNGNIIALSSVGSNNWSNPASDFYLEILDPANILQLEAESLTINVQDVIHLLRAGNTRDITPTVTFNDGTSRNVTNSAEFESNDVTVVTIATQWSDRLRITAVQRGRAQITISAYGLSTTIDVYVDVDVDYIEVEGHNINFRNNQTSYIVNLPEGTTNPPRINVTADDMFDVEILYPERLPGTATVTVNAGGVMQRRYAIHFRVPVQLQPIIAYPAAGIVEEGTLVTLSTETPGGEIWFSLNGGWSFNRYVAPITISQNTTIMAYVFVDGATFTWDDVQIQDFVYTVIPRDSMTITVPNEVADIGDEVEVTISVANNTGLSSFVLDLNYDRALDLIAIEAGDMLEEGSFLTNIDELSENATSVRIYWVNDTDVTENGILFTARFRVGDNLTRTLLPVSITYELGNIIDDEHNDVTLRIIDGGIRVSIPLIFGDVNGDGIVNARDGLKMTQFFAGHPVTFTDEEWVAAHIAGNDVVDIRDGLRLAQYLAGWDVTLGR